MTIKVSVPRKLKPLLYPKRYKGAYGGRGGAKSHFFAEQVVLKAYMGRTRIVCIREVQNSIKDSVRQLIIDKIEKFGLTTWFNIIESEIQAPNGSVIIFKGMQSYNASNIKSLEGYEIAWVEEAQTLSQHSLDLLRPTIRKDGSELWFSWNPRFKTDPVDQFFRKHPPGDAVSVLVNWYDNPWFPEVLHREMLHDFSSDPDKAEHVWNGAYGSSHGAILARWVNQSERGGRISDEVVFDPNGGPIEVSSDIGFRDTAVFWFWQRMHGGYQVLACDSDNGLDADEWIPRIQGKLMQICGKSAKKAKIWLPHDARAKTFQSKETVVEKFLRSFGAENVAIVQQSKKQDQISAARSVIPRCQFNKTACEDGLDGLRAWEFEYNEEAGVFSREPLHNWASHFGDGFCYGAQVMQEADKNPAETPPKFPVVGHNGNRIVIEPLNDLWRSASKPRARI